VFIRCDACLEAEGKRSVQSEY